MKLLILKMIFLVGVMYLGIRALFCLGLLRYTGVGGVFVMLTLIGAGVVVGCQLVNARRVASGKPSWSFLTCFLICASFMALVFAFTIASFLACLSNVGAR